MAKQQEIYVGKEGAQELYRRIKEVVGKITSFKKAEPEGTDRHPKVADPSTKIIYLVEVPDTPNPDHYKEWIWAQPEGEEGNWVCIGDTSVKDNSWKQWSEDRGSTGTKDSVYIGSDTTTGSHETIVVGHGNTIDSESHGSSVFGDNNNITLGTANSVVGADNNVAGSSHDVLGRRNTIDSESDDNSVFGRDNNVTEGTTNSVVGVNNNVTGTSHDVFGSQNTVSNYGSVVFGNGNVSSGFDNTLMGINNSDGENGYGYNTIIGRYNNIDTGTPVTRETGFSTIMGRQNTVQGAEQSTVLGDSNNVKDIFQSDVVGHLNEVNNSLATTVSGYKDKISDAEQVSVFGYSNVVDKGNENAVLQETVVGVHNEVHGTSNAVFGTFNDVTGNINMVAASASIVYGDSNIVIEGGREGANVKGERNIVSGGMNSIDGDYNKVYALMTNISGDHNIAIGERANVSRDNTVIIGEFNSATVTDDTDYNGTYIVEIGTYNEANNAANAYQFGRENTVTGNNLGQADIYPHSMAMNLGRNNEITGEGVNIGKDNVSSTFGVTVGQRNQATDASIAIGEDVNSYYGSISIGHGKSTGSGTLPMLSMTVDGEEIPAQKIKLDLSEYTYYARAAIFKNASNIYEWGEIGDSSNKVAIYENKSLNTYLVGDTSISGSPVTGYFDSNGNFVNSTDQSYDIKDYIHIKKTNSIPVDFYCSRENGTIVSISGFFRASDVQPEIGTVLNASEYTEWLSKLSIRDIVYTNLNVYTSDLTAPAMQCSRSGTNRPFYSKYSVYGYRDENNMFIPYNDATKYKSESFTWETISADNLHESWNTPESIGFTTPKTTSRNDSIAIGKSMEADTASFGVGIGIISPQITYEKKSDAGSWIGYTTASFKTLTISQVDGSVTGSVYTDYKRVWFNSPVDDLSWRCDAQKRTVMGNSIAIVNNGASSTVDNYISGASVGIGNGLKLTDNSFGFGTNIEGDNNSVLVGTNLTAQVGGSTLIGRDISVKIGDSDNDGGIITGDYDGGLVAFGMSIAPSPGSVTVGRSGVTTGRGSIAVGAFGISAKRGGVVYGRNSVSAEGRATAIGTDGISAKNASITVGLDGVNAEDGSVAFGSNGISSYTGSISIGRDGNSARNGSLALGFNNLAVSGSTSVGASSVARNGAFTFGRGMTADSAGISIGTTSGNQAARDRRANGNIVKYKNPDNNFVPVSGQIRVKSGYSIDHVRVFRNVSYDGTTYDYAVLGINRTDGYYESNSTVYLYKNDTEVTSVYRTNIRNVFNTSSEDYWRIKNGTSYYFVRFVAEKTYNELNNLNNLKEYLDINPRTFTQNEQVYVYADGFKYPTTGITTNNWIPLSSCTFDVYQDWTCVMLGYDADSWNRLTASGGYNKGIAIGANAHAEGCSFAIAPNNDVMGSSSTVSIGNRLNSKSNGLPTSLSYDIYYNGNSISANGYSAAIGLSSITASGYSFALGKQSLRAYGNSTAIGTDGVYADRYSLSIGCKTNDAYDYSFAVGQNSNFATGYSFAIGSNSNTASGFSLAIGTNSNCARDYSLAIGDGNNAETYSSVFGYNSKAYHNSIVLGKYASAFDYSTSIGINTRAYNDSTAIGNGIEVYDYSFGVGRLGTVKNKSVSVGDANYVDNNSLAMGRGNNADHSGVAIGDNNRSTDYSVTMGMYNTACGENVAIGIRNQVDNASYSYCYGIAIGKDNTSKEGGYNISFGLNNASSREAISIGTSNNVHGWSIALGVNNTSYVGLGGHATMIGQFNTSTSNQEVIHKEFQVPAVPYEPTENELSQVSQYRTAIHNALATGLTSSELAIFDNYYSQYEDWGLGRTDNYPYISQEMNDILNQLKSLPPYNLTTEDKATLTGIYSDSPPFDDWEAMKSMYLSMFEIASKYDSNVTNAFIQELRNTNSEDEFYSCINNHPETSEIFMKLQQSAFYEGEPITGKLTEEQYNIFDSNSDDLSDLLRQIRNQIDRHYDTIDEDVVCNSFLVGNNNKSNHYNSILIGVLNESQAPQVQPDTTYHTTDDDGFMIAVGYRNVVGRNYDMAFGYLSKAIGGENVALQHSEAKGYRNFAAFDSSIEGTGNISVMESNANITLGEGIVATSSVVHNTLLNTKVNVDEDSWESAGTQVFQKNIMTNCKLDGNVYDDQQSKACGLYAYSVVNNIMSNLYGGRIDSHSICDNVLLGNDASDYRSAKYNINNTESFSRNFIFQPLHGDGENFNGGINITNAYGFDDNIVLLSSVDIPEGTGEVDSYKYRYVSNNLLMHSRLIGNPYVVADNVLFSNSILSADYVNTSTGASAISNNFLLNSRLKATAEVTSNSVLNTNFLIGTDAVDVEATFSFNDRGGKIEEPRYFELHRTFRCVNFGDNDMSFANDTFVQGSSNSIAGITHSSIFGNQNTVGGTDEYIQYTEEHDWIENGINALHVMGDDNYVFYKRPEASDNWDYLSRTCILGANNAVIGDGLGANTIIGDYNDIDEYYPPITENELISKQNQLATTNSYILSENAVAYKLINGQKTPITNNSQISTYIFVSSDRIVYDYSSTLTEIEWSEFASRYNNGTLVKGHYKITGTKNVTLLTATLYEGTFIEYNDIITMTDGVVTTHSDKAQYRRDAHGTTKNILIGSHNRVRSQIHAYALIGDENEVLNTHTDITGNERYITEYDAIGNGFLQGNNNYAEDGSNIVLMGNGNSGYGHNAVAIGCQLKSNQWQTVIGKYNEPVDGPDRLTSADDSSQSNKALFIVGNGYSTKDDTSWQDEQFITRSNAMVVYADGTLSVKKVIESDPDPILPLVGIKDQNGTGIDVTETQNNVTVSLDADTVAVLNVLKSRPDTGRYVLESNDGVLSWVQIVMENT